MSNVGPDGRRKESSVKAVGHRRRSCNRHRGPMPHCGPVLLRPRLRLSLHSWAPLFAVETASTAPSWKAVTVPSSALPAVLSAPFQRPRCGRVTIASQRRSFRGGVTAALRSVAVSPPPTLVPPRFAVPRHRPAPNPALNLVRFAHWTLRDKAAQRRLAQRWATHGY